MYSTQSHAFIVAWDPDLVLMPYDISHVQKCLIIPMLLHVQLCSYLLQGGSVIVWVIWEYCTQLWHERNEHPAHCVDVLNVACSGWLLLRTLASHWNKENLDVFEAKIEESEKAGSRRESNPGHLACAASALSLSYNNWTTTSRHNGIRREPILSGFSQSKCLQILIT